MSFDDFLRYFECVQICHLTASSYSSELTDKKIVIINFGYISMLLLIFIWNFL
jgi:hypothetical protein